MLPTPSDSMAATPSDLDVQGPDMVAVDGAAANSGNDSDDEVIAVEPISPSSTENRGRKMASAWKCLSERDDSHLQVNVQCKHCKTDISTIKKSERAVRHLRGCSQFNISINSDLAIYNELGHDSDTQSEVSG
jgi:hypothetical protein